MVLPPRTAAEGSSTSLRIGIASQTPLVRLKRTFEELEADHGPLPDPTPVDRLVRSVDYSVTPGGVARMIQSAISILPDIEGEWVALSNGFPKDLEIGRFRLTGARMSAAEQEAYGRFKEIVWEALNGLPPRLDDPRDAKSETDRAAFEGWSRVCAERLMESARATPFDVHYVNDWQMLAAGPHLAGAPSVFHYHAPIAWWTPPRWKEWVLRHMEAYDAVIVSVPSYARALEAAGYDKPIHVVAPWLVPEEFERPPAADAMNELNARFRLSPEDEIILDVARMDPIKAQDRLIAAMPKILAERPNAKLLLVGNGSFSSSKRGGIGLSKGKKWRARLESMAESLGVAERVVFTGHLPQGQIYAAVHRCDVFAFPSVAEGFGLAPVEAWLAGKPIVVSRGAGLSEHIVEGANGWVVEAGDPGSWAERLIAVLSDRELAAASAEEGRKTAYALCDVAVGARQVHEVLRGHARGRPVKLETAAATEP